MFLLDFLFSIMPLVLGSMGLGWFVAEKFKLFTVRQYVWEELAYSFFIGAGILSALQFLMNLAHIPLSLSLYVLLGMGGVGFFFSLVKKRSQLPRMSIFGWIFMAGLVVLASWFFTRGIARPTYTWDSVAFWTPKMFILWQDDRVRLSSLEKVNHPEYPLLLPLLGSNTFRLAGWPNDISAKGIAFLFPIASLFLLSGWLLRRGAPLQALFWVGLLLSSFVWIEHATGEYLGTADIILGSYLLAGGVAFVTNQMRLASLLWVFAAWVKNEGLIWVAMVFSQMFLYFSWLRTWLVGIFVAFCLPWQIYLKTLGVSSQFFKFDQIYARPWVEYAVYSVHAFREEFRAVAKWNYIFWFVSAAGLSAGKKIFLDVHMRLLFFALFGQFLMYLFVFTITPEEQATFIAAAVSRMTVQIAPVAIVLAAYISTQRRVQKENIHAS